jgi:hypothetical protein
MKLSSATPQILPCRRMLRMNPRLLQRLPIWQSKVHSARSHPPQVLRIWSCSNEVKKVTLLSGVPFDYVILGEEYWARTLRDIGIRCPILLAFVCHQSTDSTKTYITGPYTGSQRYQHMQFWNYVSLIGNFKLLTSTCSRVHIQYTVGFFWIFSMYCIQHCLIRVLSDSTVSEDAKIEPRTVATSALAVRHAL